MFAVGSMPYPVFLYPFSLALEQNWCYSKFTIMLSLSFGGPHGHPTMEVEDFHRNSLSCSACRSAGRMAIPLWKSKTFINYQNSCWRTAVNILLVAINAKYIHSNLAVHSLKSYAKEYQEQIHIAEYTINHSLEYILQGIYKQKPDMLCFSCYIWNYRYVRELIEELRKLLPKVLIWAGGPEVSYESEQFLQENPGAIGVMAGEGEETFRELCAYYLKRDDASADCSERCQSNENTVKWEDSESRQSNENTVKWEDSESCQDSESAVKCKDPETGQGIKGQGVPSLEDIPGLVFRSGDGTLVRTAAREPLSMDELPFCYEHLDEFQNRIIYYETSRGCPFSCSYCLSSIDKTLRFRSISLVEKELQFFLEHKVPQVKFVDRTFNCNHRHALAIWSYLKKHDNGITNFHFEISADLLTEEELELIHSLRHGLIQLEIGVQTTHQPTIEEIGRTMNLTRLEQAVKRVQQGGNVHQHLDLIAGLPGENLASFAKSFGQVYGWKPEQLQLGFLKVLKGSRMYENRKKYGLIYRKQPPYEVMATNWLSYEELLEIKLAEEMLEVYYNSGQFEMTVKVLELTAERTFALYLELGKYYEKRGLLAMSHSRIRRSEILLDFAAERDGEHLELYRETLTFDLYARENMKSRPAWAPDQSEYRELTRKYCKKGKMSHLEPFWYGIEELREQKTLTAYPQRQRERQFYLFSYEERNPLTGQAAVKRLDEKGQKEI